MLDGWVFASFRLSLLQFRAAPPIDNNTSIHPCIHTYTVPLLMVLRCLSPAAAVLIIPCAVLQKSSQHTTLLLYIHLSIQLPIYLTTTAAVPSGGWCWTKSEKPASSRYHDAAAARRHNISTQLQPRYRRWVSQRKRMISCGPIIIIT